MDAAVAKCLPACEIEIDQWVECSGGMEMGLWCRVVVARRIDTHFSSFGGKLILSTYFMHEPTQMIFRQNGEWVSMCVSVRLIYV